ncbi:SLATT domain-containing protein [Commensalibacter communis]|uniref:SLATT domain-containing protein n=1 Tax=Commensalibacter communis TaxID=2972786 RepID=UPI0022FF4FE1|nr:SLATT domain-containing protein [Commensalibacter communis]CAI3949980.1 unnamed protein product [Commensalibacter communis]CAI3956528.1 unnamed protein product [Commensalibacter communis]
MNEDMKRLANGIWWTKKSKILAEARLLKLNLFYQCLFFWYSVFLVFCSIYTLVHPLKSITMSVTITVFSITLFALSLFINGLNYKERAILLKKSYEALSLLYTKCQISESHEEIDIEYQSILSQSENHKEIDFIRAIVSNYNPTIPNTDQKAPTCRQKRLYWGYNILYLIYILMAISSPILVILAINYMNFQ